MGVMLSLVDNDKTFDQLPFDPVIINDVVISSEEDNKQFNDTIYSVIGTETFDSLPKCQCGTLIGRSKINVICDNCREPVKEPVDEDIETYIWARAPKGTRPFVHPQIWILLRNFLSKFPNKFDMLMYLCDQDYRFKGNMTEKFKDIVKSLEQIDLHTRNYGFFVDNFDKYMDFFFFNRHYKQKKKPVNDLYWLIKKNKHLLFCNYIQIPNKSLLIMEKTGAAFNYDSTTPVMIDAIRILTGIDTGTKLISERVRMAKIPRFLSQLATYHEITYADVFGGKPGIARRQISGSRVEYSFRTVITSLSTKHDYDEIHIPWPVAMNVFKIHLVNKLLKMDWSPNKIFDFLDQYALSYHPLLDALFKELIAESPYKGIPCFMNRNPSLLIGSIQLVYIPLVKNGLNGYDINDVSTSVSPLTVGNNNADFDGDEENFMILLDNKMAEAGQCFGSFMNVTNMRSITGMAGSLDIPKPVALSTAQWISDEAANTPEIDAGLAIFA